MAAPLGKKRKVDSDEISQSKDFKIFIIPKGIQKQRLSILQKASTKRGIPLISTLGPDVTHIVTSLEDLDEIINTLVHLKHDVQFLDDNSIQIVKDKWLSKCLENKSVIPVSEELRLYPSKNYKPQKEDADNDEDLKKKSGWVFFSPIPLKHFNQNLSDALEVLQADAEFRHEKSDTAQNHYSRALAFRRSSSVIKTLTYKVTAANLHTIKGLPHIGQNHVYRVIQEIVDEGFSEEIDRIQNDDWFQKMKLFTKTFGVGATTAKRWISMGLQSIDEARKHPDIMSTTTNFQQLSVGLAYYEDLSELVNRNEAEALAAYVRQEAERILPGATVELCGGFRRGKENGHDIDLLISHPEEGLEVGLLPKIINRLTKHNIILYNNYERGTFSSRVLTERGQKGEYLKSTLDYFEKWIGVLKIDKSVRGDPGEDGGAPGVYEPGAYSRDPHPAQAAAATPPSLDSLEKTAYKPPRLLKRQSSLSDALMTSHGRERGWLARRVDLIVTPASQHPWALVGWTGSRHLNRELRRYADQQDSKLTSHGMYRFKTEEFVKATSEREVFEKLGVPYLKPEDRNA